MAGVRFNQVCNVENRKVNATQILCDLYIDIVPTVLLNNIEQGAPPEETFCAMAKIHVTREVMYEMERDNLTTSTTTTLFIVHLAGMLLHRWYLSWYDKKEFGYSKEGSKNWERKKGKKGRRRLNLRIRYNITIYRSWVRLLP